MVKPPTGLAGEPKFLSPSLTAIRSGSLSLFTSPWYLLPLLSGVPCPFSTVLGRGGVEKDRGEINGGGW